jgi:hypothetical protein
LPYIPSAQARLAAIIALTIFGGGVRFTLPG